MARRVFRVVIEDGYEFGPSAVIGASSVLTALEMDDLDVLSVREVA